MNEKLSLPKTAIIIANYNYSKWVKDAIRSAVQQDYPNTDVYVVDDCSTDDSIDIIMSLYPQKDIIHTGPSEVSAKYEFDTNSPTRLFVLPLKENGGPSRARNVAIREAIANEASFIAILDADDIMAKNKISKCVWPILEHPEQIGFVYADYMHLYDNNTLLYESKEPYSYNRLIQNCIVHSGFVVSVMALHKVAIGNEFYSECLRVAEDYSLLLRLGNYFIGYHIAEPLTIVRVHDQNSTSTVSKERWQKDYYLAKQIALGGL